MIPSHSYRLNMCVASYIDAWIEIDSSSKDGPWTLVASYIDAWIEISTAVYAWYEVSSHLI